MASKEARDVEAGVAGTVPKTIPTTEGNGRPTTKVETAGGEAFASSDGPNGPNGASDAVAEAAHRPHPSSTSDDPSAPPNGGLLAWLAVLGAFFFSFNSLGITESFAIFQQEYSADILSSSSKSAISWIGTIQTFVMFVVAVLCGKAVDAGYGWYYLIVLLGVPLEVFGFMMASLASSYWSIILSQGIVVGIGAGMMFMPSIFVVSTYFSTWGTTALAIAAAGSSIGGIVYPSVLRGISSFIGLHWAMRVMAFLMLGTLAFAVLVTRPRKNLPKSGPLFSFPLLRTLLFGLFLGAVFFLVLGLYVPYFYVVQYGTNIGTSERTASHMLMLLNAAAVPGRIVPALLADKIGRLTILIISTAFSGVIALAWIAVKTEAGLIAVSLFFGLASGAIQVMVLAEVPDLLPDPSLAGTGLGITLFVTGLGSLIGSPVAGAIIDSQSDGSTLVFWGALLFTGLSIFAGLSLLVVVRIGVGLGWK